MPTPSSLLASLLLFLALACTTLRADILAANRALQEGRVSDAASLLQGWLAQHPDDAAGHLLLCRSFYAQDMPDPAIKECEAATTNAPSSSDAHLWLGRAYGMKAGSAHALLAFSLARKVRDSFETAVRLDSSNIPAMGDLGEFYVAAPVVVGGGAGKARDLAARLTSSGQLAAQSQGHRILALLAEKNGDLATAEAEFRRATSGNAVSASNAGAWVDLGAFFSRHGQPDQAAAAVRSGIVLDRARGPILVDAASVLTAAGRDPDLARRLLREYLASPGRSDAAPAFKVHLQLGDLLARSGDLASAKKEFAAALTLSPDFPPARKASGTGTQAAAR